MPYDMGRLGGVSVLVIEDDPSVRDGLSLTLLGWGCRVRAAASLTEAERVLTQPEFVPDIIISDLLLDGLINQTSVDRLPMVLTGHRFTGSVVAITGDTRPGLAEQVAAAGWTLLTKPFTADQLHATLAGLARPRWQAAA